MKYKSRIILGIFLTAILAMPLSAQFETKFYLGGGIETSQILGDNHGQLPMLQRDTSKADIRGGGFISGNPGITALLTMMMDKEENLRVPIGISHYFYNSAQLIPASSALTVQLRHIVSITSLYTGAYYSFASFELARARAYGGVEVRGTFIYGDEFSVEYQYKEIPDELNTSSKESAFRLGGAVRLGVEGKLWDPWYVNISGAYSVINLFGRDNARGELLTPKEQPETEESYLQNFHFAFILQFRI